MVVKGNLMLGQAPEISETLEWMLQSRQVGVDTLVKTLIQEQYSHVYRFVSSIIDSKDSRSCEEITEQIISAAIEDSPGYQGDMNVNAWLCRKSIAVLRKRGDPPCKNPAKMMDIQAGSDLDIPSQGVVNWYAGLTYEMRVIVTLFFLFDFSPYQIAVVVGTQEAEVAQMLEYSKGYAALSGDESKNTVFKDLDIKCALAQSWPIVVLDGSTEKKVAQRILDKLRAKDKRKRHMVFFSEAFLAILAIFFVISLGGLIGRFTPQPTPEIIYETRMVNHIVNVTPTPGPTQLPRPFPDKAIIYEAIGGETLHDIADKIYFNAQILAALNHLPANQPLKAGQQVMIGISDSLVIMPTMSGPGSTPKAPAPLPAALTIESDEAVIKQRITSSIKNWQTLWADALVIQYGPPGYVGEPDYRRQQIWIDQPYFHYLLDGENGGDANFAYSAVGGWENLLNIQTGDLLSNLGPQELHFHPALEEMLFNTEFEGGIPGEIEIIGQDMIADREVLILERYAAEESLRGSGFEDQQQKVLQGRYWIDMHLGSVLRAQKFTGNSANQLFQETIISEIIFNIPIPRRLYDRSQYLQTYFAEDHTGDYVHEPIAIPADVVVPRQVEGDNQYQPPSQDFEVRNSYLEFYWTSLNRFSPERGTKVDLFGDGYFLGEIEFAEPEQLVCTRSPDGEKIAFSSWSNDLEFGFSSLGWLNLNQLPEVRHFNPDLVPYDYAFSNDSRQLAVYACQRYADQACGIYILQVDSGASRLLRAVEQGAGMIWSPDGGAIAIQGSFLKEGKWRLLVLDSISGHVIYEGPFDWEGFWVPHDSPLYHWGVQYPPLRGGLELCMIPPRPD
jgi:DNA-directed RNA polymerase specialized sigma24 family protein